MHKTFKITLLKRKRLELGFTAEQVAEAIGIKKRMYYYIESKQRNPSWEVAQRLEQFFGISASELLAEVAESNNQ